MDLREKFNDINYSDKSSDVLREVTFCYGVSGQNNPLSFSIKSSLVLEGLFVESVRKVFPMAKKVEFRLIASSGTHEQLYEEVEWLINFLHNLSKVATQLSLKNLSIELLTLPSGFHLNLSNLESRKPVQFTRKTFFKKFKGFPLTWKQSGKSTQLSAFLSKAEIQNRLERPASEESLGMKIGGEMYA